MAPQPRRFADFLFCYYAHAGTFATYASLLFAARGMSAAQVGILMSLVQVMRIIGPNVWGWLADRTGQRLRVLRLTAVAAIAAFTAFFFAHGFWQLFGAMVLLNLFTSAQSPLSEALALAEMRGDLSGYGRIRLWGSLGFIVAVTGVGYALESWGVDSLLWLAGGMLLLVLAASLRIEARAEVMQVQAPPPVFDVLRQRQVLAFFASTALMVAAHTSLYVYYSLYLEQAGYSKPVIGAMWSLGVAAEVLMFYFQAPLFRRFGARRMMTLAFMVAMLRFCLIGGASSWLAVLLLAQLMHAFTFAAHHSASVITMQRWFDGALQARGQALYMSIAYGVGGSCGGLFMSLCWDSFGPHAVYFAAALLSVLGYLAFRQVRQPC